MMNNLIIAATLYFATGVAYYGYYTLRSIYWDVRDSFRESRWRREADARMAELNKTLTAEEVPTSNAATPVVI